jgi:hypothetical protein
MDIELEPQDPNEPTVMAERLAGVDHDLEVKFNEVADDLFSSTERTELVAQELIDALYKQSTAAALAARVEEAEGNKTGQIVDSFRVQAIQSYSRAKQIEALISGE